MPLEEDPIFTVPGFLAVFGRAATWTPEAFKAITPDPLLYYHAPKWEQVPSISIESFETRKLWTRVLGPAHQRVHRATETAWVSGVDRYLGAGVTYLAVLQTRSTAMAALRAMVLRPQLAPHVFTDALNPFYQYVHRDHE